MLTTSQTPCCHFCQCTRLVTAAHWVSESRHGKVSLHKQLSPTSNVALFLDSQQLLAVIAKAQIVTWFNGLYFGRDEGAYKRYRSAASHTFALMGF